MQLLLSYNICSFPLTAFNLSIYFANNVLVRLMRNRRIFWVHFFILFDSLLLVGNNLVFEFFDLLVEKGVLQPCFAQLFEKWFYWDFELGFDLSKIILMNFSDVVHN